MRLECQEKDSKTDGFYKTFGPSQAEDKKLNFKVKEARVLALTDNKI